MSVCHEGLAPEAMGSQPQKIDEKLLNILVHDPAASSAVLGRYHRIRIPLATITRFSTGLPVAPSTSTVDEKDENESLAEQGGSLAGFPRRYATVEEVDEAFCKNRSRVRSYFVIAYSEQL